MTEHQFIFGAVMKFKIIYKVGQEIRSKNILAKNLDEAVSIADKKVPKWLDVKIVNPKLEEN